ncbi:MAG: guanylate kinase [Candidatus Brocadiia bacterium]
MSKCSTSSDASATRGAEGRQAHKAEPRGQLVVLSGPAGAGKTTVAKRLCEQTDLRRSVSATTRSPRRGEVHGRDYYFVTEEEFRQMVARGEFLEHARVHGHLYGTPRRPIENALRAGESCLLVIDVQGAMQVREQLPHALLIFLDAPDEATRARRLGERHTEDPRDRQRRRAAAAVERHFKEHYDHYVVNDDLGRTVAELRSIIVRGPKPEDRRHAANGRGND